MDFQKILNKDNLHHAYCIEGDMETVQPMLISFLEKEMGIKTVANPDFYIESHDTFSVEESRQLKERQQKRAFGNKKIFIISFSFITREAQNALLKIFEEPTSDTHFFIITNSAHAFLSTLKSRLVIVSYNENKIFSDDIQKFFKQNVAQRLAYVKDIIEAKDKNRAVLFVMELERYMTKDKKNIVGVSGLLGNLLKLKKFLFLQGASIKLVLEHVALTCPRL